jgi:hypothetical protein
MSRLPVGWKASPPASEEAIAELQAAFPTKLPAVYIDLMRVSNGGSADLGKSPWTADLWPIESLVKLNAECGMESMAPSFVAFGSNLGEEVLAFKKADGDDTGIYMLPWHSPSEESAKEIFASLEELLQVVVETGEGW